MKRILAACALLLAGLSVGAWVSAQVNGAGGVYINGVLQAAATWDYLNAGGISMTDPTTDVAPGALLLKAANAWPGAATNVTGANTILAPGIGKRIYTIVDYTGLAASTVTVTVNGSATVLTEPTHWTAATSNAATAASLAAAINAVSGLDASASGSDVRIVPDAGTYSLTIAKSATNSYITATSGTDGSVIGAGSVLPDSDNAVPLGSSAYRFTTGFASTGWSIYKAASEANPTATLGDGVLNFGAGTTNAVDAGITREGAAVLRVTNASTGNGELQIGATAGDVGVRIYTPTSFTLNFTAPGKGAWATLNAGNIQATGNFIGALDASIMKLGASGDVGLGRSSAGVLKATDGSTGYGGVELDTNARQWADTVTLSDNVKTAVVDIAIADAEFIGGTLTYTITATDATNHQALTGIVGFSGVRKAGTPSTYHLTIAESASPVLAESAGASTLTDTWAIDAGTNVATISVTADSSLTTPTMTVRYQLTLNSANAVTKK